MANDAIHVIDISAPLTGDGPFWPGSPGFSITANLHPEKGDAVINSVMTLDVHAGTHLDAPSHHDPAATTIDGLSLDRLIGPAEVVRIENDVEVITADVLERSLGAAPPGRLLLKTGNSASAAVRFEPFRPGFAALDRSGAEWIASHEVLLVGIDYLSIQRFGTSNDTHKLLFDAGVVVLEGLDLCNCDPGRYTLVCLPLSIPGAEAAPARAVLLKEKADGR